MLDNSENNDKLLEVATMDQFTGSTYQLLHYYIQEELSKKHYKSILEALYKYIMKFPADPSGTRELLLYLIGYEKQLLDNVVMTHLDHAKRKLSCAKILLIQDPCNTLAFRVLERYIVRNLLMEIPDGDESMVLEEEEDNLIDTNEAICIMIWWIDYHQDELLIWKYLANLLRMNREMTPPENQNHLVPEWQSRTWWWQYYMLLPIYANLIKDTYELIKYKYIVSTFLFGEHNEYARSVDRAMIKGTSTRLCDLIAHIN